jgi:hypothetical protein
VDDYTMIGCTLHPTLALASGVGACGTPWVPTAAQRLAAQATSSSRTLRLVGDPKATHLREFNCQRATRHSEVARTTNDGMLCAVSILALDAKNRGEEPTRVVVLSIE